MSTITAGMMVLGSLMVAQPSTAEAWGPLEIGMSDAQVEKALLPYEADERLRKRLFPRQMAKRTPAYIWQPSGAFGAQYQIVPSLRKGRLAYVELRRIEPRDQDRSAARGKGELARDDLLRGLVAKYGPATVAQGRVGGTQSANYFWAKGDTVILLRTWKHVEMGGTLNVALRYERAPKILSQL